MFCCVDWSEICRLKIRAGLCVSCDWSLTALTTLCPPVVLNHLTPVSCRCLICLHSLKTHNKTPSILNSISLVNISVICEPSSLSQVQKQKLGVSWSKEVISVFVISRRFLCPCSCLQSGSGWQRWPCCRLFGAVITGLQQRFTHNWEFTGVGERGR